jgi:hypothetical protein
VCRAEFLAGGNHASVAAIYIVSALAAALGAEVFTARNGAIPSLVRQDNPTAAVDQVSTVVGPASAGLLVGAIGLPGLRIHRQAWAVIVAVCVWGAVTGVFGCVRVLWAALA